jgi:hypothetical protein
LAIGEGGEWTDKTDVVAVGLVLIVEGTVSSEDTTVGDGDEHVKLAASTADAVGGCDFCDCIWAGGN